jgi:hypothetical protein
MAIAACVIAILYFILYYLVLVPRCAAVPQPLPDNSVLSSNSSNQPNGNQPSNGNNYTPLKIYHTSRGRKGHFRY